MATILILHWITNYNHVGVLDTHPVALPAAGCRCHPSREWLCHTRKWGAARTEGQSAASHRFPPGSGTRKTRKEEHARSRRTGPGSAPARKFQSAVSEVIYQADELNAVCSALITFQSEDEIHDRHRMRHIYWECRLSYEHYILSLYYPFRFKGDSGLMKLLRL